MKHNWLNDTSRDLNKQIREHRQRSPSIQLRNKWHEEFISQGIDKRQSFASYVKHKTKQWRQSLRSRKTSKIG